ncbi:MAG: adenylate/guanylate cyclase domain-containing protein [Campylobacterota bacterium]|nr:adenylate/guanylate cyclase domain-containing protein [Campylobacterota bacterium]
MRTKKFSIKLSELFTILLSGVAIILISYNFYKSYDLSYIMLDKIQKEISSNIVNVTNKTLEISANHVKILSKLNGENKNILEYKYVLSNLMKEQLATYNYLNSIYIANINGDFLQLRRHPQLILRTIRRDLNGTHEEWEFLDEQFNTLKIEPRQSYFDPRDRSWFYQSNANAQTFWSNPYKYASSNEIGITISSPYFDYSGVKTKVAGADITSSKLHDFLVEQSQKVEGNIVMFDKDQNIIASSFEDDLSSNVVKLSNFASSQLVRDVAHRYNKYNKREGIIKDAQGNKYLYFFSNFPKDSNSMNWRLLIIIPQEIILGQITANMYETIIISMVILILFILIVLFTSKRLSQPIIKIANQIKSIEDLELNRKIDDNSKVEEIHKAQASLKSLQVALSSFIKYLPVELIKKLIEVGQEAKVDGEERELAIMFTDIENFTTISENMNPKDVALQLSEYFGVINDAIAQSEGTIDKYIGDAVLAFWGAPQSVDKPCHKAIISAYKIQEFTHQLNQKWQQEGKPIFKTRIGIHYGKTLVGNIGSNERLNYTVIGDSVNIASRLEGVNKEYSTYLLFSQKVNECIQELYTTRYVDTISLKGKTKSTQLYTIDEKTF